MIAELAVELGIAPQHLIEAPPDLLDEMVDVVRAQREAARREALKTRLRAALGRR